MHDISAFGFQVSLIASVTYPIGIILSQWADDQDPFDIPSLQIADSAMGINGDLIKWSKANPVKITLSVVPNSRDDALLAILLQANRVGRGKVSANDEITIVGVYPTGRIITLSPGVITDGMPGNAVSTAGRLKSKTYAFSFEGILGL